MTLLDALDDPALFAPAFPRPHWNAWRAFCAALYGLDMSPRPTARSTRPPRAARRRRRPARRKAG